MRIKLKNRFYSKLALFLFIMMLTVIVGMTGCDSSSNDDLEVNNSTVTGDLRYLPGEGEDLVNTDGLVILTENGTEVEREYVDDSQVETSFQFKDLKSGNYKITVYDLGCKTKEVEIPLEESQDLVLDEPVVLEGVESERALENILYLNPDQTELENKNIRMAIASAIDRGKLKEDVQGRIGDGYDVNISTRLLSPTRTGYEDTDLSIDYSIENAEKYREDSGINSSIEIDIHSNDGNDYRDVVAEEIQGQFNELNQLDISLNSKVVDWQTYIELKPITNLGLVGHCPIDIIELLVDQVNLNERNIADKTVDDLIKQARLNQDDVDKVMESLLPIEKLLLNEAYFIPVLNLYKK